MSERPPDITVLLGAIGASDQRASDQLLELVYADLRRLAGAYLRNERPDHILQPTALVHEAYLRLVDWKNVSWQNRAQFFAVAANVMRNILVDHARKKKLRNAISGKSCNSTKPSALRAKKSLTC